MSALEPITDPPPTPPVSELAPVAAPSGEKPSGKRRRGKVRRSGWRRHQARADAWVRKTLPQIQEFFKEQPDSEYTDDLVAARQYGPGRTPKILLVVICSLIVLGLLWSAIATVEQVTRGEGHVIPSSKIQVVQSLEGGLVKELIVRPGQVVKAGQPLLRIDDTGFASSLGELSAKQTTLTTQIARLEAELRSDETVTFSPDLTAKSPAAVQSEKDLFDARKKNLESQVNVLQERQLQKEQELAELKAKAERSQESLRLAQQELNLNEPLARQGIVPRADFLRLQREVNDLKGELDSAQREIPRAEASLREATQLKQDASLTFQKDTQAELNQRRSELAVIQETLRAAQDRVSRTEIRSPVDGVVNTLHVNTIGGVVRPGDDLVEIVPMDDTLLIEARVKPKDIAFIGPGQRAIVKLTAYDFGVYGSLEGKVERIGADAIVDQKSGESYYTITVRTEESALKSGSKVLPIIPGMIATVDIVTGERSILAYLLKPLQVARDEALRER